MGGGLPAASRPVNEAKRKRVTPSPIPLFVHIQLTPKRVLIASITGSIGEEGRNEAAGKEGYGNSKKNQKEVAAVHKLSLQQHGALQVIRNPIVLPQEDFTSSMASMIISEAILAPMPGGREHFS